MCGFSGCYFLEKNCVKNKFNSINLNHRGPDDQSSLTFNDYGVFLGHTRTSIIDLTNGSQPLSTSNKDYTIIFNGGIYNFEA